MTRARVIPVRARTWAVLAIASVAGLAMFVWPLLTKPASGTAHHAEAPYIFIVILPVLVAVIVTEIGRGGLDVKAVALLGVLAGVGAAMRPLGAGTAGIETVFFLLILAGRVYGPGFGFVLGSVTLFASALFTAGVGPWLPFQMLAASWVGLGAGLLPRAAGRAETLLLAAYGAISAYAYGLLLNLWFWPFALGTATATTGRRGLQFVPGDAVLTNLRRFVAFTIATSTLGWDTGRAITNVVAISVLGTPVLAALRRARRRAAFDAAIPTEPVLDVGPQTAHAASSGPR